jgi:sugar phosphate isomerase/epimerase
MDGPFLSFSTCWLRQRHNDGRRAALDARELGFEWLELGHGTRICQLPGLFEAVKAGEIRVSSLHNFCPPPVELTMDAPDAFEFSSAKGAERQRALDLTQRTLEMANRFAAAVVVLHLGSSGIANCTTELESLLQSEGPFGRTFLKRKLELVARRAKPAAAAMQRARACLDLLLPLAEKHAVKLAIETRSHHEQLPNQGEMLQLMNEYGQSPWLGCWHDFGHAQRQANLHLQDHAACLKQVAHKLLGCHLHDVRWPQRDHLLPFQEQGGVPFEQLLALLPMDRELPLVWEISPREPREKIPEALAQWRSRFPQWS